MCRQLDRLFQASLVTVKPTDPIQHRPLKVIEDVWGDISHKNLECALRKYIQDGSNEVFL